MSIPPQHHISIKRIEKKHYPSLPYLTRRKLKGRETNPLFLPPFLSQSSSNSHLKKHFPSQTYTESHESRARTFTAKNLLQKRSARKKSRLLLHHLHPTPQSSFDIYLLPHPLQNPPLHLLPMLE